MPDRVDLSLVICTHNPRADFISATLAGVAAQEPLPTGRTWEVLVIDNASTPALAGRLDLSHVPGARIISEEQLGLTHARLRSFREARGDVIVFVDDDNVLSPRYLRHVLAAFDADTRLGAAGGRVLPVYELQPPEWFAATGLDLACRDLGDIPVAAQWTANTPLSFPDCAPIGAGMAIRRDALAQYVAQARKDPRRTSLGRKGNDLASGEDNDMMLSLLTEGWKLAYLPDLSLEHLIPASRLTRAYLERYAYSSNKTWVQVLALHQLSPWPAIAPWTAPIRKARAFLKQKPWRGPVESIAWRAACGVIEGRAASGNLAKC